jgi:hypothetical protein
LKRPAAVAGEAVAVVAGVAAGPPAAVVAPLLQRAQRLRLPPVTFHFLRVEARLRRPRRLAVRPVAAAVRHKVRHPRQVRPVAAAVRHKVRHPRQVRPVAAAVRQADVVVEEVAEGVQAPPRPESLE